MTTIIDIAAWLREKRAERGISQAELAKQIRVSQGTVSNWERSNAQPDEVQMEFLRRAFGEVPGVADPEVEGLESSASTGWEGEYPLDAVFVRTDQRNVVDIVRRIKDNRYDLSPDFQRAFVWDIQKQSRLIESCLMRIPLPVLYVAEAPDGRIIVVDGLQRLTTFRNYLGNGFKLTFPTGEDETKHLLEGKYFKDLEEKLRERIEDTSLTLYILDPKAPERAKLDIFERVNGGEPLTRQQMRNCLYNGKATQWLRRVAESTVFLKATGDSLDAQKMRDREAINRFCSFRLLGWRSYKSGDMDGFLAEGLKRMNQMSDAELEDLKDGFDRALTLNWELFGQHAFRKSLAGHVSGNRSILNIALFEVCTVLFSQSDGGRILERKEAVKDLVRRLIKDPGFEQAITYGTNSRKPVSIRFERLETDLRGVLA